MDPQAADEIEAIRDQGENLLWAGRPHYVPFVARAIPLLIIGGAWGSFDFFLARQAFVHHEAVAPMMAFMALHSFPAWGSLLFLIYHIGSYHNAAYGVTDRRLVFRSGFWGVGFESVDFDQVASVDVSVGPIERMIGAGTLRIDRGRVTGKGAPIYDSFVAIDEPYEVYKLVKSTAVNVKTDWNYPNKLRPAENPGYQTRYAPEAPPSPPPSGGPLS